LQQLDAEGIFQLSNLGAKYLLSNMDPAGRRGKAHLLGNGHEIPQMAQLDIHAKYRLPVLETSYLPNGGPGRSEVCRTPSPSF
jgi:hypothetical protein